MKIIEKAIMPDGTSVQLEDWSGNNTKEYPDLYGLEIGAYPIAKNSYTTWIKKAKNAVWRYRIVVGKILQMR